MSLAAPVEANRLHLAQVAKKQQQKRFRFGYPSTQHLFLQRPKSKGSALRLRSSKLRYPPAALPVDLSVTADSKKITSDKGALSNQVSITANENSCLHYID